MDTLANWMSLTTCLVRDEDWRTICRLSIAFGREYIDYYNRHFPIPHKRGDVFWIKNDDLRIESGDVTTCVHNYMLANITRKKQEDNSYKYRLGMHRLVDSDSEEVVLACPFIRPDRKTIPIVYYITMTQHQMFYAELRYEHYFGCIEYKKIT